MSDARREWPGAKVTWHPHGEILDVQDTKPHNGEWVVVRVQDRTAGKDLGWCTSLSSPGRAPADYTGRCDYDIAEGHRVTLTAKLRQKHDVVTSLGEWTTRA